MIYISLLLSIILVQVFSAIVHQRLLSHTIEGTCMKQTDFEDDADGRKLHIGKSPYQFQFSDLGGEDVLNDDLQKVTVAYWRYKRHNMLNGFYQGVWQFINMNTDDPPLRDSKIFAMQQKAASSSDEVNHYFFNGEGDWQYSFVGRVNEEEWVYEVVSINLTTKKFKVHQYFSSDYQEYNMESTDTYTDPATLFSSENLYLNIATDYQTGTGESSFCGKIRSFDIFFGLYIGDLSDNHFYASLKNQGEFRMMRLLHIYNIPNYSSINYLIDNSKYDNLISLQEGVTVDSDLSLKFQQGNQIKLERPMQVGHPYNTNVKSNIHLSVVYAFWVKIENSVQNCQIYKKSDEDGTHVFSFGFQQNGSKYDMYINWLEDTSSQETHTVPSAQFQLDPNVWNRVTFTLHSEYPEAKLRYSIILGDNDVKILDQTDSQITASTSGYPKIFEQNNSRYTDIIGDKDISTFNGGSFYLKDFQVVAGSTVLLNPIANEIIENCVQAMALESDIGSYTCLLCSTGYVALQDGDCHSTCLEGFQKNADTRTCDSTVDCAPKCDECDPSNPNVCITCSGNRIDGIDRDIPENVDLPPLCICPPGFFDAADEQSNCVNLMESKKSSTGYFEYNVAVQTTLDQNSAGNKEYSLDIVFDIPFIELPEVVVGFLNYELTDSTTSKPGFLMEITDIQLTQFTAKLTLKPGVKMNQISFSYFAHADVFIYKTGYYLWNTSENTVLSTAGDSDKTYTKSISITNWQGNLQADVMIFMNSVTLTNINTDFSYGCSISGSVVQRSGNVSFNIAFKAYGNTQVDELGCGYIIFPRDFGSSPAEEVGFSDTDDYVYSQHQQNPYKAIDETIITQPALTFLSDRYFSTLQYTQAEGISAPPVAGISTIPFGVQFGPRETSSKYEILYETGFNAAFKYKVNLFIPQQTCDIICNSCILFQDGSGPCSACNLDVTEGDPNRSSEAPLCGCNDGYYDKISTRICSLCAIQCSTCVYEDSNCLSCEANRVGTPTCDCTAPEHRLDSISLHPIYSPWCSTCSICVPKVTINDSYTRLNILFDYEIAFINLPGYLNAQVHNYEICDIVFNQEMLDKLGKGAKCAMNSNNTGLEIIFGGRPPIFPGDLIYFEPSVIRVAHSDCDGTTLDEVYDGYAQFLGSLQIPEVTILYPKETISICESVDIQLLGVSKDFNKGIKSIKWSFVGIDPAPSFTEDIVLKEVMSSFTNKNYLFFPSKFLKESTVYDIKLEIETYIGQTKSEQFTISTKLAENDLNVQFEVRDYQNLYTWQNITLTTNFYYVNCETGQNEIPEEAVIQWKQLDNLKQNITINAIYQEKINKTSTSQLVLPTYIAEPIKSFQIEFTITSYEITKTLLQTITFQESPLVSFIVGGNKAHAISEELTIELFINDPDFNPIEDQTYATLLSWSCNEDTIDGAVCQKFDQTGDLLDVDALENEFTFTLPAFSLHLHKLYYIQYNLSKYHRVNQDYVLIIGSDVSIPKLDIKFPLNYYLPQSGIAQNSDIFCDLSSYILNEEELAEGITYQDLQYSVSIIYEDQIRATIKFSNSLTKFKLWEHFSDFRKNTFIELRYQVYSPIYLNPFQQKVILQVNSPPFSCQIMVTPANGVSMDTLFDIQMTKCLDLDDSASKLIFKYFVYHNPDDYLSEITNTRHFSAVVLTEQTKKNYIQTFLPQGDVDNGHNVLLMVQVQDAQGSLTNFTKSVQVTENIDSSEEQLLEKIESKLIFDKSQTLEQYIGQIGLVTKEININPGLLSSSNSKIDEIKYKTFTILRKMLNKENYYANEQILNIIYYLMQKGDYINKIYQQDIYQFINSVFDISTQMKFNGDNFSFDGSRTQEETNELEVYRRISEKLFQIVDLLFVTISDPTINPDTESYQPPELDSEGKFVRDIIEDPSLTKRNLYLQVDQQYEDGEDGEGQEVTEKIAGEITKKIMSKLYDTILLIPKLVCADQYPNDEPRNYHGSTFTSINQRVDRDLLNKEYLQVSTGQSYFSSPQIIKDNFYNSDKSKYLVSFKVFHENPFKYDVNLFPWTKYNKFQDPFIQKIRPGVDLFGDDFSRISLDVPISHLFEYEPTEIENTLVCVTLEKGYLGQNIFMNNTCTQSFVQSQDGSKFFVNCLCSSLNIATIVDDIEQVFNPTIKSQGLDGEEPYVPIDQILNSKFVQWAVFWILLVFTIAWLVLSLQGYHMDKIDDDFFITSEDYRIYIRRLKEAERKKNKQKQIKPTQSEQLLEEQIVIQDDSPNEFAKQDNYNEQYQQNTPPMKNIKQFAMQSAIQEENDEDDELENKQQSPIPKRQLKLDNLKNVISVDDKNIEIKDTQVDLDDQNLKRLNSKESKRSISSSKSSRSKFSLDQNDNAKFDLGNNNSENLNEKNISNVIQLQLKTNNMEGSPQNGSGSEQEEYTIEKGQQNLTKMQMKYKYLESFKKEKKDKNQVDENIQKLWWNYVPKIDQDSEIIEKKKEEKPLVKVPPPKIQETALEKFLKSQARGLIYFHRYTSPIALYDNHVKRPKRITLIYFNLIFYFMFTGVLANAEFNMWEIFLVNLGMYFVMGIFDNLCLLMLNTENFLLRALSFLLLFITIILCVILGIENARYIEYDEVNEWGLGYTFTIINEFLLFGLIDAIVSFNAFKWGIKNQDAENGQTVMNLIKGYLVIDNINSFSPEGIEEQLQKQQEEQLEEYY